MELDVYYDYGKDTELIDKIRRYCELSNIKVNFIDNITDWLLAKGNCYIYITPTKINIPDILIKTSRCIGCYSINDKDALSSAIEIVGNVLFLSERKEDA